MVYSTDSLVKYVEYSRILFHIRHSTFDSAPSGRGGKDTSQSGTDTSCSARCASPPHTRIQPDWLTHTSAKHQAAENKNEVSRDQQLTPLHVAVRCDRFSIVQKILTRFSILRLTPSRTSLYTYNGSWL